MRFSQLGLACAWMAAATGLAVCCSKDPSGKTTTCSVTFANSPGPTPTCTPSTGNVTGYVIFSGGAPMATGADVVVQYSTDSFGSNIYTGFFANNGQGFLVMPFSFSVDYCGSGMPVQIRAFQSTDHSLSWVSGNSVGRYDGTSNGNAAFVTATVSSSTVSGVIVSMDGTVAQ